MPVIKLYQHGISGGVAPRTNDHKRMKRGQVEGWSIGATRRNMRFLMSVAVPDLTGAGVAFTLTLKDCPPTPEAWHRARRAFEKRMVRAGMVRMHWVTEWQRRGVPHLHGVIWFPKVYDMAAIVTAWLEIAAPFGASRRGQHAMPINDAIGWFQYLSKHAARGVKHYQRSGDNVPAEWQKKTGRVWGKCGDWSLREPVQIGLDNPGWFAFRRLCRSWRVADARASGNAWRIRSARSMLTCPKDRDGGTGLSQVRGVSEWIEPAAQEAMMWNLAARGFLLFDRATGQIIESRAKSVASLDAPDP